MLVYILMPYGFDRIIAVYQDIEDAIEFGQSLIMCDSYYDEDESIIYEKGTDCPRFFVIEEEVRPKSPR